MIRQIWRKTYQNYLMGSRLPSFRDLLKLLHDSGYTFLTIEDLASRLLTGRPLPARAAIIRCDVDSDLRTASLMLDIAASAGAMMTWYWRLSTLDKSAMQDTARSGHENGYHFEELATVAKRRGARTKEDIATLLPEMKSEFCRNLETYAAAAGSMPRTVASHGDFANRLLKTSNSCLIDQEIREKYGIVAEAYDRWLRAPITRSYSDVGPPQWWVPTSPLVQPPDGPDCIHVLVHPRQYYARIFENTALDLERAYEGVSYAIRRQRRAIRRDRPI